MTISLAMPTPILSRAREASAFSLDENQPNSLSSLSMVAHAGYLLPVRMGFGAEAIFLLTLGKNSEVFQAAPIFSCAYSVSVKG